MHLDLPPELIPEDYLLLEIDLGELGVEAITELPADPAVFGDAWLAEQRTPVLQVPSFIVPESSNPLLNPLHPNAELARILGQRRFTFDRRLWLPL